MVKIKSTKGSRRTVKNGEEQWNPKHGSTMERRRDLRVLESCGDRRRFIWSRQVDAAAGVGEDKKTRGGGGGGARAQHSGERKKMEVAKCLEACWAGLFIRVRLLSGREKRGGHGAVISP